MQHVKLFSESVENCCCGRDAGVLSSSEIAESEIDSSSTTGADGLMKFKIASMIELDTLTN